MTEILARAHGQLGRPHARQGRLDAPDERQAQHDGLVRDHRRAPHDRERRGVVRAVSRHGASRRVLLRRRHDEHRRVPRGAELRRDLEAAGRVRLREQSLYGVHVDPRRDGRRASRGGPRERVRPRARAHRRQRRRRRVPHGAARARPRAQRRRPEPDRSRDLSPRRPLARRPGQVPPRRGSQGVAREGSAAALSRALARDGHQRRPRSRRSRPRRTPTIDRATEIARNAPPPPLELADKDVWADGGSAWRN